jgi:cytochrome c biogenesis protein CcdA
MANKQMSKEEIAEIKRKRASDRRLMIDKLRFWVGVFSVPTILIMACMLIAAAYYLGESQLAVVTGLISTITLGLINVLTSMVAPPAPEDPLATVAKDLVHHLQDQSQKDMEVSMDRNKIKIGGNGVKMESTTPEDPVWGDDVPLTKKKKGKK